MVKIRLRRVGAKKQPHYRIVVADSKSPRDGKVIETIGHYNPRTDPPTVEVDQLRALYWLSVGAQPTAAVERMLDKLQVMARAEAMKRGEVSFEDLVSGPEVAEEAPELEAAVDETVLAEVDWALEGAAEPSEGREADEDWDESDEEVSEEDEEEDWDESDEEGLEEGFDVDQDESEDEDLDDDEDWDEDEDDEDDD